MQKTLKLHPLDNVVVALTDLNQGETISYRGHDLVLLEDIGQKHKVYLSDLPIGAEVLMYGLLVGKVTKAVMAGQRMSVENLKHAAEPYVYRQVDYRWTPPDVSDFQGRTFQGYHRSDGKVGTANYWLFIPTVFCENRNLDMIKSALQEALGYAPPEKYKVFARMLALAVEKGEDPRSISFSPEPRVSGQHLFPNVDGIKFLNHQGGCGGTRQDSDSLSRLLAAYANHPNVGGVTLLSLGCQHLQVQNFMQDLRALNPNFDKPLLVFEQQQMQSEEQLVSQAIQQTFTGLQEINRTERRPAPLSRLTMGVKCGGSDGFSGISANPAVGHAADMLVALGGKVLLAEFPELCGAEQDIIDRCTDRPTAEKFIRLMQAYDARAHAAGSGFFMNPSPGNIRDGLITDAIKSLGASKKAGHAPVVDVLDYTEEATKDGLSLVCTPGNDVEATTGKTASGANLILFTTGLGTPTGNPVCPVIKLSSNSALAERMGDIIDFDTGGIIRGEKTIEQTGREILEFCIRVASGEVLPKAVQLAQDDFIPWKRGVSL